MTHARRTTWFGRSARATSRSAKQARCEPSQDDDLLQDDVAPER